MYDCSLNEFRFIRIGYRIPLLVVCWLLGLCAGIFITATFSPIPVSLMRATLWGHVSIVGAVVVLSFPLIISAIASACMWSWLFYLIAVFKSFSLGYVASCLYLSFGSAGWLMCILVLLPDFCVSSALLCFLCRRLLYGKRLLWNDCLLGAVTIVAVSAGYYYIVAPYLNMLSQYV